MEALAMRYRFSQLFNSCTLPLLLWASQGFAQDQAQLEAFDKRLSALETKVKEEKIYNSPARAEVVRGYNLFFYGDFLYLEPEENGLDFAIKTNDPTFASENDKLCYKNLDFDYKVGFRVGCGFNIPHDSWDLNLCFTHFDNEIKGHSHAKNGDGLFPIWSGITPVPGVTTFVLDARAHLRLNLNVIDVELGREYDVGKWLTMRPSMGIRTGFINQHYHILYSPLIIVLQPPGTDNIKLKNEYWGVGPKAGIATQWNLGRGFSIYGSADISLLFGEFEIRRNEVFENLLLPTLKVHHAFHQVRAITDLAVGIGWDLMLAHDQYHLGIRAGYEQHLYFGQNQLDRVVYNAFSSNIVSNLGDLSLQGWAGSLRVDF
jgi:hypothetical protein